MKTEITVTMTKDCYILCDVFRFMVKDLLVYYMKNVSLREFVEAKERGNVHPATDFFMMCMM